MSDSSSDDSSDTGTSSVSDSSEHSHSDSDDSSETLSLNSDVYGCKHYKRACMIYAPCCKEFYDCHHCHNEENEETHLCQKLDISTVKKLKCMDCLVVQDIREICSECGIQFGGYSCLKCVIFDDTDKGQYHCDKCKICRVGGKDSNFHCDTCDCCLPLKIKDSHKCLDKNIDKDCPICLENMFNSTTPIQILRCGHTIHLHCLEAYLSNDYRCPLCFKGIFEGDIFDRFIKGVVELEELPEEFKNKKVSVLCNECGSKSETMFHFTGLKCMECESYNTKQI